MPSSLGQIGRDRRIKREVDCIGVWGLVWGFSGFAEVRTEIFIRQESIWQS